MEKTQKNFFIYSIVIILVVFVSMIMLIYFPLKNELENELDKNFILQTEVTLSNVNSFLDGLNDGAVSISNRGIIRDKIISYKNGKISLEYLKKYTSSMYPYAINGLSNLEDSARVVDNKFIVPFNEEKFTFLLDKVNNVETQVTMKTEKIEGEEFVVVVSPILNKNDTLGYDIIVFNIERFIEKINTDEIKYQFSNKDKLNLKFGELVKEDKLIKYCVYLKEIDASLVCSASDSILYNTVNIIRLRSIVLMGVIIVIALLISNLTIVRQSNILVKKLITKSRKYERIAKKDQLTNAWTRHYFIEWMSQYFSLNKELNTCSSLIMIDINKFKNINDTFGHKAGDEALKILVDTIKSNIRNSDIVVCLKEENKKFVARCGGDEFLVFLPECPVEKAELLIKEVEDNLTKIEDIEFKIEISYGIEKICTVQDIDKALEIADEKMYKMKAIKNK